MPRCYLEDDSDSEEEQVLPKKRRIAIKSGKVHTTDTTVLKQIVWPHKLVYDLSGRPAAYDDLPLLLFIQGYLAILQAENLQKKDTMLKHFSGLMADAAIYGWESMRAFHAVGLQQLENGHTDWGDEDKKLEFWKALMWNKSREVHTTKACKSFPAANTHQKTGIEATGRPTTAKPGTKACAPYNAGNCNAQAEHPMHLHICAYCLSAAHHQCAHQERFCHRKIDDEAAQNGKAEKN